MVSQWSGLPALLTPPTARIKFDHIEQQVPHLGVTSQITTIIEDSKIINN
jgi:hypothetical protein